RFAGSHRPTLFHLRNWRKSISVAGSVFGKDNFMVVGYEDLITQKYSTLSAITDFLNVEDFKANHFSEGIKGGNGQIWRGNSSTNTFNGINENNKNKFKKYLNENTIKYIEYMCQPEMKMLKYQPIYAEGLGA